MNNGIFRSAKEVSLAFQRAVSKEVFPQSGPFFEGLKKQVLFYEQSGLPDSPLKNHSQNSPPPQFAQTNDSCKDSLKEGDGRPPAAESDRKSALAEKKAALREWLYFPLKKAFRPQNSLPPFPASPLFFPPSSEEAPPPPAVPAAPASLLPEASVLRIANGAALLRNPPVPPPGVKIWSRRSFLKGEEAPPPAVQEKIYRVLGEKRDSLCCLNNLFSEEIVILSVEKSLLQPLEIQFLSGAEDLIGEKSLVKKAPAGKKPPAGGFQFRLFVFVKEGVKAEIFETFHNSGGGGLIYVQTDGFVGAGAELDYIRLDCPGAPESRRDERASRAEEPVDSQAAEKQAAAQAQAQAPEAEGMRAKESKQAPQTKSAARNGLFASAAASASASVSAKTAETAATASASAAATAATAATAESAETAARSVILNRLFGHIERAAQARFLTISLHSKLSRFETALKQKEKSRSEIRGFSLLSGRGSAEHRVSVLHLEKEGESNQLYQSLVLDSAKHAFRGLISIAEGAQKTNAKQLSGNRVLGEKAFCAVSPELDVSADDVKAHHGASVSSLEESREALFYLQSRGLSRQKALELITEGAIHAPLAASKEKTRKALFALVRRSLQEATAGAGAGASLSS